MAGLRGRACRATPVHSSTPRRNPGRGKQPSLSAGACRSTIETAWTDCCFASDYESASFAEKTVRSLLDSQDWNAVAKLAQMKTFVAVI